MTSSSVILEELPEWLLVEFDNRDRVLKLEGLEHLWMKDTDCADLLSLEHDIRTSLWEELLVLLSLVFSQEEVLVLDRADLGHQ